MLPYYRWHRACSTRYRNLWMCHRTCHRTGKDWVLLRVSYLLMSSYHKFTAFDRILLLLMGSNRTSLLVPPSESSIWCSFEATYPAFPSWHALYTIKYIFEHVALHPNNFMNSQIFTQAAMKIMTWLSTWNYVQYILFYGSKMALKRVRGY